MNALMQDVLTGEIADYFGGLDDIRGGIVRHVNEDTFSEDPLRVLRAAQFAAIKFDIAEETVASYKDYGFISAGKRENLGRAEEGLAQSGAPVDIF